MKMAELTFWGGYNLLCKVPNIQIKTMTVAIVMFTYMCPHTV